MGERKQYKTIVMVVVTLVIAIVLTYILLLNTMCSDGSYF